MGLAASAQTQAAAKPSGCALRVTVTDEDGKALPKAFVLVHGEHGANQQFTPDKDGHVGTKLHSGMYDLFVSAMGFVPQAQILDLRTCKPLDLNLTLSIDSEHTESNDN
jgi:Carboxypeptidase regulatory-like domain